MPKTLSGFLSYHVYIAIKNLHFKNNSYNITKMPLPKRDVFMRNWNLKRVNTDGTLFQRIQNKVSSKGSLIALYSAYWAKNPDFYILDILEDDYLIYKHHLMDLRNVEDTLKVDFMYVKEKVENSKLTYNEFFRTPQLMMYAGKISPVSLAIFDKLFNINYYLTEEMKSEDINILFRTKWDDLYKVFFKKFYPTISEYIDLPSIKEYIKKLITN